MKNVTDYFEITVAHGHINGTKLANFVRKKIPKYLSFTGIN